MTSHRRLLDDKASIVTMGRFYMSLIDRGLWPNQRAMAKDFRVSMTHVSRSIGAARLPESITRLFVGKKLSQRDVARLKTLVAEHGEAAILKLFKPLPPDASASEILASLIGESKSSGVKVSVVKGQKYLRIDVPDLAAVLPRIPELEEVLNLLLAARIRGT